MVVGMSSLIARLIDSLSGPVNADGMDDDFFSSKPDDPLVMLARQDLDPFSQDELAARIEALEAEIARVRAHRDQAARHRSQADELFRR
jgi:uncharacterized small protein (DUF1192 family)